MKFEYVGWTGGNDDKVIILVKLPLAPLNPNSLFEDKTLMLYGRRTGKLRAKLISWYDQMTIITESNVKDGYENCRISNRKLKHLIPQIQKHYSWAILSA